MKKTEKNNRKNKLIKVTVACAALLLLATFAWFTGTDVAENIFRMDYVDVKIVEEFDPNTPVTPGMDVVKKAGIVNNSNTKVAVRVKLKESLQLPADYDPATGKIDLGKKADDALAAGQVAVFVNEAQLATMYDSAADAGINGWNVIAAANAADVPNLVVLERTYTDVDNYGTKREYFVFDSTDNRLGEYSGGDAFYNYYTLEQTIALGDHTGANCTHLKPTGSNVDHHTLIKVNHGADWHYESGYFYYKKALDAKMKTDSNVVETVKFEESMDNQYQGAIYTLDIEMEYVQGNKRAAEASLWPATAISEIVGLDN